MGAGSDIWLPKFQVVVGLGSQITALTADLLGHPDLGFSSQGYFQTWNFQTWGIRDHDASLPPACRLHMTDPDIWHRSVIRAGIPWLSST